MSKPPMRSGNAVFGVGAPALPRAQEWGLVGTSARSALTLELDEGIDQPSWRVTLDMPGISINFDLDRPGLLVEASQFLQAAQGDAPEFDLATWNGFPATLIRDDEFPDRAFLLIGEPGAATFRMTFAGPTFHDLVAALDEVASALPTSPAE